MSAAVKLEKAKAPETVAELIAWGRTERRGPAPAGDLFEPATLRENLTLILNELIEEVRDRWPRQPMRWDGNNGRMVPDGPLVDPFDATRHPTVRRLAILLGYIEDGANRS